MLWNHFRNGAEVIFFIELLRSWLCYKLRLGNYCIDKIFGGCLDPSFVGEFVSFVVVFSSLVFSSSLFVCLFYCWPGQELWRLPRSNQSIGAPYLTIVTYFHYNWAYNRFGRQHTFVFLHLFVCFAGAWTECELAAAADEYHSLKIPTTNTVGGHLSSLLICWQNINLS